jgi:SAM-dependent methyltransferase
MQVILDPTNQYIAAILSQCELHGRDVLEIGCGNGRLTRDLARHARRVVATDPDGDALAKARLAVAAANVEFMQAPSVVPDLPAASFDVVIYTLSLHQVPAAEMPDSLRNSADLLREGGVIVVVEPGEGGSYAETSKHFAAGSGDQRSAKMSAIRAMQAMEGWKTGETIMFRTLFQFDGEEDFFACRLPDYPQKPDSLVAEVRRFLDQHRVSYGIVLDAYQRLNLLRRCSARVRS